jgi:hypothetical protein
MTKQKNTGASASIKRGVPVAKVSNADNATTKEAKAPSSLQQWGIVAGICAFIYFVYQQPQMFFHKVLYFHFLIQFSFFQMLLCFSLIWLFLLGLFLLLKHHQ